MFKNQILVFSLVGRETILQLVVCGLLSYFNETSGQKLVRKPNGSDEASFCEDEFQEFSFVLVEAPTNFNYNSLKAECCPGEDVLAVRFLKTAKVLECFRDIS